MPYYNLAHLLEYNADIGICVVEKGIQRKEDACRLKLNSSALYNYLINCTYYKVGIQVLHC